MLKKVKISIIFLLFFVSFITTAQAQSQDQPSQSLDVGSWMIKKGMDLWWYSVGDSLMSMGNGGNTTVSREDAPGLIFRMITYTVDPFEMQWVKDWWGTMLIFYTVIVFIVIMGGGAWVLLHSASPDLAQKLDWIVGKSFSNFQFKKWIVTILKAAAFPYLVYFAIYVILVFNYTVSGLITDKALNVLPFKMDNVIAYLFMAGGYFGISVIMAVRNIVIVLFAAGGLGIAALYLVSFLQDIIETVFFYFILVVFMQPILIFEAAVGLTFVQNLPDGIAGAFPIFYIAVLLIMILTALIIILPFSVSRLIGGAKKVILT